MTNTDWDNYGPGPGEDYPYEESYVTTSGVHVTYEYEAWTEADTGYRVLFGKLTESDNATNTLIKVTEEFSGEDWSDYQDEFPADKDPE